MPSIAAISFSVSVDFALVMAVTAAIAAYRAWRALGGPAPAIVAGHSLGEYSALVAAGALGFADALPLVRFRAQAMQEAVPEGQGAMAAILGLDEDVARAACDEAAHGEVLQGFLKNVAFVVPAVPVINNVDVKMESDPARIKDALVRQAASPVRWVETIRAMAEQGVTHIVECGPGKVLAGLVKRIDPKLTGIAAADRASLEQALATIKGA